MMKLSVDGCKKRGGEVAVVSIATGGLQLTSRVEKIEAHFLQEADFGGGFVGKVG